MNERVSPYQHLEPLMWRRLLSRAACFHAARRVLGRLVDVAEHERSVELVLGELEMVSQRHSDLDCDDVTVVAGVASEWDAALTRTIEHTRNDEARTLLVDLRELVRSATGDDPFHVIFEGVQCQAQALYGPSWRPTRLSVAHTRSHPRGGDRKSDPYAVTAFTQWPPDPMMTEVELRVFCDEFGPAAYAALPMLLTHELVCHVPARQDRAKNDSEFAEGFLDWAAYYFLARWACKVDPLLAPAARTHAHRLRQVLAARPARPEVHARRMGHQAAENLAAWFESDCGLSSEESEARVARLAVQLNLIDRPLNAKDNLVVLLSSALPPTLEQALREWVSEANRAEQLLDVA